ncbi:hypothetical protein As57867_004998, partial [Aphanomyces stellatus]
RHRQGAAKLQTWVRLHWAAAQRHAIARWQHHHECATWQVVVARASTQQTEFAQAKDCVFELSRAASSLREANAALTTQVATGDETVVHLRAELQLTKHGFVATVLRRVESEARRMWFHAWREHVVVARATATADTNVQSLQRQLDERDRFTKSLDAYNKVLQTDLERVQFVTQDTRLAVEVLSKKLLREEARGAAMADAHAMLQAEMHALCSIDGDTLGDDAMPLPCPRPLLAAAKDVVLERLVQVFGIHADHVRPSAAGDGATTVYVMSWDNCYELVQSTLCATSTTLMTSSSSSSNNNVGDDMDMLSQLESFFPPPHPITLRAFVTGLAAFLEHMADHTSDDGVRARLSSVWRALIDAAGDADDHMRPAHASSWARKNKLSDEILQNQEKLLAVLEHETAVVERAVLDKASLKHTYPGSHDDNYMEEGDDDDDDGPHHGAALATSIDDAPPPTDCLEASAFHVFGDWLALPQVRDLVLAYQLPLLQLFVKYATATAAHQLPAPPQRPFERQLDLALHTMLPPQHNYLTLSLQGVLKLFEDLKLFPVLFPPDVVARLFTDIVNASSPSAKDRTPLLLGCPGFIQLFGTCILTTYAGRPTPMSIRERLHTFFYELHWSASATTTTTTTRHPKPCYVGQDIEAILWPLFEYYCGDRPAESHRLSMTATKFCRFMTDIAGLDKDLGRSDAELMFRKAVRVSRGSTLASRMVFDEFYMGIYYMHQLRDTTKRYESPGDALREWMQQL